MQWKLLRACILCCGTDKKMQKWSSGQKNWSSGFKTLILARKLTQVFVAACRIRLGKNQNHQASLTNVYILLLLFINTLRATIT